MNKLEKIRELKEEICMVMKQPWGYGRTSSEIVLDILSILEEDVKEVPQDVCCGKFETCNEACVPRADYFKENSRVELNKLALSILKESLKDKKYRESWEFKIEAALYEAVLKRSGDLIKSENMYSRYGNDMAKVFMDRLFGEIE